MYIFKPVARGRFLEIDLVRASVCVCVSVCPPPGVLIASGVIWCDIGRVQLVKQVSRLFPAHYFIHIHVPYYIIFALYDTCRR